MKVEAVVMKYTHSLIAIGLSLAIMFAVLNFLHTRGPGFVQGPAGTIGAVVSGSKYNF